MVVLPTAVGFAVSLSMPYFEILQDKPMLRLGWIILVVYAAILIIATVRAIMANKVAAAKSKKKKGGKGKKAGRK